jgi:8-oxo-dGTP diphosphatase
MGKNYLEAKRPLCAAMTFLFSRNKVLMLERTKPPHSGKIVPPGGKVEAGEIPLMAAAREVREETGLPIDPGMLEFCGILSEASPIDYNWTVFLFRANVPFFEPPVCSEGVLKWVSFDKITEMNIPESDFYVYKALKKGRSFFIQIEYDDKLNILETIENSI